MDQTEDRGTEKKLEEMTEQELLVEIACQQRKAARSGHAAAIATAVLAVVFVALLLLAAPAIRRAESTLAEAENVIVRAQESLENLDELTENLNTMVTGNTEAVNKALSQISQIDMDSLNSSIQELARILTPLAKLFGR